MISSRCLLRCARLCRTLATFSTPCCEIAPSAPRRMLCSSHRMYVDEVNNGENTTDQSESGQQSSEENIYNVKSNILEHALDHVVEHGWSRRAISLGAEDAGYAGVAEGMFVNEGCELVMYFVRQSNQKLLIYLKEKVEQHKQNEEKIDVNVFIRDALEFRLRLIIPYISVWAEAMTLLLSPKILNSSLNEMYNMVDDIWYLAGDRSSDINWYTKRGILAKLYGTTQLYMLSDQSPDFEETWCFIQRRLDDIKTFALVGEGLRETSKNLYDVTEAGFTAFRNIVGMPVKHQ